VAASIYVYCPDDPDEEGPERDDVRTLIRFGESQRHGTDIRTT
jgi:hypothetical protein